MCTSVRLRHLSIVLSQFLFVALVWATAYEWRFRYVTTRVRAGLCVLVYQLVVSSCQLVLPSTVCTRFLCVALMMCDRDNADAELKKHEPRFQPAGGRFLPVWPVQSAGRGAMRPGQGAKGTGWGYGILTEVWIEDGDVIPGAPRACFRLPPLLKQKVRPAACPPCVNSAVPLPLPPFPGPAFRCVVRWSHANQQVYLVFQQANIVLVGSWDVLTLHGSTGLCATAPLRVRRRAGSCHRRDLCSLAFVLASCVGAGVDPTA